MITVKKFFCCFKLRTGAMIVGWFGIISSLIFGLGSIGLIAFAMEHIIDFINERFSGHHEARLPVISNELTKFQTCPSLKSFLSVTLIVFSVITGFILLNIHISMLLIRGTQNVSECTFFMLSRSKTV